MISDSFRVLIVGGGTSGLALAHGLKKIGIEAIIFERDSESDYYNKTRDWGMSLHWGQNYLSKLLPQDLQNRLRDSFVDPHYYGNDPVPHINAQTAQIIGTVSTPQMHRVSRKKLRHILSIDQGLDIKFSKRAILIEPNASTVAILFDDGTQEIGHLVVGCDGSRSKIREFLVGKDKAKSQNVGLTIINHSVTGLTAEQTCTLRKYHPIVKLGYDPSIRGVFLIAALDVSDINRPQNWKFQIHHSWWESPSVDDLKTSELTADFFKERTSRLCKPFLTAGQIMSEQSNIPVDYGQQWAPDMPWDNYKGAVTLAGDAAHSMLPHRGQGLNNALQDAAELVEHLQSAKSGTISLETAITAYEDEMRLRGTKDVALSLDAAVKTLASELPESAMFKLGLQKPEGEEDGWHTSIAEA